MIAVAELREQFGKLLDELEELPFSSAVSVASGLRSAIQIVQHHGTVRAIEGALDRDQSFGPLLLNRIREIAERPVDPSYSSPFDAALLGSLVIVLRKRPGWATLAATLISGAPGCWWAARFASMVLSNEATFRLEGVSETSAKYIPRDAGGAVPKSEWAATATSSTHQPVNPARAFSSRIFVQAAVAALAVLTTDRGGEIELRHKHPGARVASSTTTGDSHVEGRVQ